MGYLPLRFLHADATLSKVKLVQLERLETEYILATLVHRKEHCLKVKPDGTILDGHHRIFVLRARGVEVNLLPREIVPPQSDEGGDAD